MDTNIGFHDADNSVLDSLDLIHKFKPYNDSTLEMIAESYLWFASLRSLNDPFEGGLSYKYDPGLTLDQILYSEFAFCTDETNIDREHTAIQAELKEYQKNPTGYIDRKREEHKKSFERSVVDNTKNYGYFCALSAPKIDEAANDVTINDDQQRLNQVRRNQEDISLWSHYGDGLRGIRITYDPLKLKQMQNISTALVTYQDNPEPIDAIYEVRRRKGHWKERWNHIQSLTMFNTKATLWANEREVRIRTGNQGKVRITPNSIKCVTFGEKMPKYRRVLIIAATIQHNPNATFYEARISKDEFKIEYTEYEVPPLVYSPVQPASKNQKT
ncbi:DUF2971 domain-containing protein [Pseudomonas sp. CFBP 8770]|uniref:DUF2971 domain-containing protein n=1 Tax=unclassified Pseudomonas TaxID=196821 RepID=UPI001782B4E2|nr:MULTISPECIES: DUF2971 domain-containing protein [unclassified Pseudomonas]MBD8473356.1 DUF2971 domain-containing protein [Pseudomonas sp. CFBP 8773]MBD8646483.1 DUF2971 domain-containing protein [Pseudomonas sp. CFBP 8770]